MADETVVETKTTEETQESQVPSQDRKESGYTEEEKAAFNLKKAAEKARSLGQDPTEVLGIKPQMKINENLSDDTPLTVGAFRQIQKQDAQKTALDMVDTIENELEREAVREALQHRVKPSGNAQSDFDFARSAVNTARTTQIAQEQNRKTQPSRTASGGSAPGKSENHFEPSAEEAVFMAPPYNLTKEQIIANRQKLAEKAR